MRLLILGACGTFMGGLAALARERGDEVVAVDAHVYPPMSTQLAALGIALHAGYEPKLIADHYDLVVVGNALSRGWPIVEALLDSDLPYCSGPEWLARHVLPGRRVVAVAGTHGKTTTSALIAHLLEQLGAEPGFLIGGAPRDFPCSARLGRGSAFVVEADEYDSAFFDKRAKFVHYRPEVAVLNNLEYDHADIYPDLAAIERQFHHLVRTVKGRGRLIVRAGDAALARVLAMGAWTAQDRVGDGSGLYAEPVAADGSSFVVQPDGLAACWSLHGAHNVDNALAALAAVRALGYPLPVAHLASFNGVKRRLELRFEGHGIRFYEDFAHHPTAIARTLEALRGQTSGRLIALFEPRSRSMRAGAHAAALPAALAEADLVLMLAAAQLDFDPAELTTAIGPKASSYDRPEALLAQALTIARSGDVLVAMSNGGFAEIPERLARAFATEHPR